MSRQRYIKGATWERSLKKDLEARGFFVLRSAHSGGDGVSPDLVALSTVRKIALECKAWRGSVRIEGHKFRIMCHWQAQTGVPVFIAWKHQRDAWRFFPLCTLRENATGYTLTERDLAGGLTLDEVVGVKTGKNTGDDATGSQKPACASAATEAGVASSV